MAGLDKGVPSPTEMWRHYLKRIQEAGASREPPAKK